MGEGKGVFTKRHSRGRLITQSQSTTAYIALQSNRQYIYWVIDGTYSRRKSGYWEDLSECKSVEIVRLGRTQK
jgi:hypothetical protein